MHGVVWGLVLSAVCFAGVLAIALVNPAMALYSSYSFHFRQFLRGIVLTAALAPVIAAIYAAIY
jgi:hypothetical protein